MTVNGTPASVKADNTFEGKAAVTAGNNTVTVVATDVNGNTATNRYNLAVTGSGSKTLVYDANGNLTSDGTRTFEWDPRNRLAAVTSGTHRSEFTYNGLSQRVKLVEKDNGAVTSTKQFVWIPRATQPSEERDGTNVVTKRYYAQGMQVGTTNYYYTRDHLGSVRELADGQVVLANVMSNAVDEVFVDNVRLIFVAGTQPASELAAAPEGATLEFLALPRLDLNAISAFIDAGGSGTVVRKLPYEMIVVGGPSSRRLNVKNLVSYELGKLDRMDRNRPLYLSYSIRSHDRGVANPCRPKAMELVEGFGCARRDFRGRRCGRSLFCDSVRI